MIKTAVITGSESFGKYISNPTKWLAIYTDGKVISGHKIHSLVFPAITRIPQSAEDAGTTIVKTAQAENAKVIISYGLSSAVRGFRIERSATNWSENKYCQVYENGFPLSSDLPPKEVVQNDLSRWDVDKIQRLFGENGLMLEEKISDDPGQYSCNSWIYRTIKAMSKLNYKAPYIFVHTACTESSIELMPDFPRDKKIIILNDDLIKSLELLLQCYI